MVADAVVRHWVLLVAGAAESLNGWLREVLHHAFLLYANKGLVVSTKPEWIQGDFDTFTGLFDSVGHHTNVGKKYGMLYRPFREVCIQSEEAYEKYMTGYGPTNWSHQRL